MQKLIDGIIKFRKEDFEAHKELFMELKDRQIPHTLFIACSDSRIDPNLITGSKPGELFIIRNIANIVPPYRDTAEFVATTSAIEYAVLMLGVENIIVCGHSNCGGCAVSQRMDDRTGQHCGTIKTFDDLSLYQSKSRIGTIEIKWVVLYY